MISKQWLIVFMLLLVMTAQAANSQVQARLEPSSVAEGERVLLILEAQGLHSRAQPDLSPLAADFDVVGTRVGQQTQIINGRRTDSTQWQISLLPKRLGVIEIAALQVGDQRTAPLRLEVTAAAADAHSGPGDPLWVELSLDQPADLPLWVHQQIPLVLRIYSALPLRGGQLSDPRAENGVLERPVEDRTFRAERDGRSYQVIERRYLLQPERSGVLRVSPAHFEGELPADAARSQSPSTHPRWQAPLLDSLLAAPGRRVRAQSEAVTLEIEPRPAAFTGTHWLPAQTLDIDDSWETPPQLEIGEPATRTLTITAKGLMASQIPPLDIPLPADARAYSEPMRTDNLTDGVNVHGVSKQSVTLIPTQGGTMTLPEIRVPWWDTVTQQQRVTRVPARTLTVTGVAASSPTPDATNSDSEPATAPVAAAPGDHSHNWQWLIIIAVGLGLLYHQRQRWLPMLTKPTLPALLTPSALTTARHAVRESCARHDTQGASQALLLWARQRWPESPPTHLSALAERLGLCDQAALAQAVRTLEQALYAPQASDWNGDELWSLFASERLKTPRHPSATLEQSELAPLYPGSNF